MKHENPQGNRASNLHFLIGFCLATLLFFMFKLIFEFPFNTDDYWHLLNAQTNQFHLALFGGYMARVPFWCLTNWASFASGLVEHEALVYTLGFAVNAFCLMALARILRQRIHGHDRIGPLFVILCIVFSFFPNDYETLYWLSCLPFVAGLPLLVLGWSATLLPVKILCYVLSFCFGEMFILPALALELVPWFFPREGGADLWAVMGAPRDRAGMRSARRQLLLKLGSWLCALLVFLSIRKVLSLEFGAYSHALVDDPRMIPIQLQKLFSQFFVLSYYKTFWPPTLLYWLALLWVLLRVVSRGVLEVRQLINGACFVIVAGGLVFVMGYFAPRALYGASVCVNAALIIALEQSLLSESKLFQRSMLLLIAMAFFGQTLFIFQLKDQNARILKDKEMAIVNYLNSCDLDCKIDVELIPQGLKRGWVLHPDYVKPFVLWIAARHRIEKPIRFVGAFNELNQVPITRD